MKKLLKLLRLLALPALKLAGSALGALLAAVGVALLIPVGLLLGLVVLGVDLLWTPFAWMLRGARSRTTRELEAQGGTRLQRSASIVIVSWNGQDFLSRLLPSLDVAIANDGGDHEIIVVDNGSEDDSIPWMKEHFPHVKIVALPENRFFVRGNMAGVKEATKDIVVFLNNDMIVFEDFLSPLLEAFDQPDVFGVTSEVFFRDPNKRREETGKTAGRFRNGFIQLAHLMPRNDERRTEVEPTFWAGGGSSAFDRKKFLALGGFDTIYDPFYLEDTGLSYQAWKRGWDVLFTADSRVFHEHRGTSRKVFGDDYIDNVIRRNQYLFVWRNITDARMTLSHFASLPLQVLHRARQSDKPFANRLSFEVRALAKALPRLPLAIAKRCGSRPWVRRSDRDTIRLANSVHQYRQHRLARGSWQDTADPTSGLRILVLCARMPRLNTDGSWILFNLLRELSRRHRVTVFGLVESAEEAIHAAEPLREFCTEVITHPRLGGSDDANLHWQTPERFARDYSNPHVRRQLEHLIQTSHFDVLQVEYAEMAHMVRDMVEGLPTVYTCHEPMSVFFERIHRHARGFGERWSTWWAWKRNVVHELRGLRAFRHIVTLSDADEAKLSASDRRLQITSIPSGIDIEGTLTPTAADKAPIVLFVGYYRHPPNVDGAIWLAREVMPLVRAEIPDAVCKLVGKDPVQAVQDLDSLDGIEVTGFVPELTPYMDECAAVAVPIRTGGGLRGKVLEAWAAGKAVVAHQVACEGFATEDGVHLLQAADATTFAAHLVRCLRDGELRKSLGEAGLELVRANYSSAAMARRYETVYAKVLEAETAARGRPAAASRPDAARPLEATSRG